MHFGKESSIVTFVQLTFFILFLIFFSFQVTHIPQKDIHSHFKSSLIGG